MHRCVLTSAVVLNRRFLWGAVALMFPACSSTRRTPRDVHCIRAVLAATSFGKAMCFAAPLCLRQWGGAQCNVLMFQPVTFPQGYGMTPNVTSWGGNVIADPSGKLFHLFVAEMVEDCPLQNWQSNSQCTHATSPTIEGPYTFQDAAVPVWCHNPQAVVLHDGSYALFHIGDGDGGAPVNCTLGDVDAVFSVRSAPS